LFYTKQGEERMIIGVPREIKDHEARVSLVPAGVRTLVYEGHRVLVENSAGEGSGISDEEYFEAGAIIRQSPADIYKEAELIIKVKEPLPEEYKLLREEQILFTYLHLAPALELTKALLQRKVIGIAYETVQLEDGSLPLLIPMSEISGRMSIQIGCQYLQKQYGGSGVLLGGVPGTKPGNVTIIGGGTVGTGAAKVAIGMGANVTIIDAKLDRLRHLCDILLNRVTTLVSNSTNIESAVADADLVIGAILSPGARAKCLVTREMVVKMRKGSVIVDVAIDQGGCVEGAVPTTFDNPTYEVGGIIYCCLPNIPSAVPRTSTYALNNATMPYILELANQGYKKALQSDESLSKGLNVIDGKLVCKPVAESLGLECTSLETYGRSAMVNVGH
jgi:alanine dehydrogenase